MATVAQHPAIKIITVFTVLSTLGLEGEAAPLYFCSLSPDPSHDDPPGLLVNCSGRGFHTIPADFPLNTTTLLLSSNILTTVPDDAFFTLGELRELDLSQNKISSLQHHAFRGLSELRKLSLWRNRLSLSPRTYPSDLFEPLVSLTTLIISHNRRYGSKLEQAMNQRVDVEKPLALEGSVTFQMENKEERKSALSWGEGSQRKRNTLQKGPGTAGRLGSPTNMFEVHDHKPDLDYPVDALSHLVSLRYLSMDGLTNRSLEPGFRNLTQLTHLDLNGKTGYCNLVTVHSSTFANLPNMTHLNLSDCRILNLTHDAFQFSPNLADLDLSFNQALGFNLLSSAFYGLSHTRLTNLTIDYIVNSRSLGTVIESSHLQFFKDLQYLERLQARFNRIEGVETGALCGGMPPNLRYLNVVGNFWELAPYVNDMNCLERLERLDANGREQFWSPSLRPPDKSTDPSKPRDVWQILHGKSRDERLATKTASRALTTDEASNGCKGKQFHLPPRLQTFSARDMGLNYQLLKVSINSENNLKKLDLSRNYLPVWEGPLCGFNNLTELYLVDTSAKHISNTFFMGLPALEILDISKNMLLRPLFRGKNRGKVFQGLKNLRVLNMSYNNVGHISPKTLRPLENLEELYLSVNGMANFTLGLTQMNKLHHLDISSNQIHTIPKETRDHLDEIAETVNVTVNMTFNPISCSCDNIEFLKWIRESKVYFGTEENYFCLQPNGLPGRMEDLMGTIAVLERQCGSYVGMFVGASASCTIFLTILLVALGYRFRWKLRYLYYASRLGLQRQQQDYQQVFRFDAFVSFSSEDSDFVEGPLRQELEDRRDLRLCIHTRDFTPGQYIASNIVSSVQRSRRTLVILSRALLESDWCHYELQMALMEGAHTGREVLVFLIYENVPAHELSREMLANLQATVYIEFPHNEMDRGLFWARLAQALRE